MIQGSPAADASIKIDDSHFFWGFDEAPQKAGNQSKEQKSQNKETTQNLSVKENQFMITKD